MARPLSTIEQELRSLSTSEKESLLQVLWEELDGPPDPEVESAWLAEIRRRAEQIDAGLVELTPAEAVFARLYSKR